MHKKIIHLIFILISISMLPKYAFSQSEWNFKEQQNGIQAWTRQVKDSKFEEYKVETIATGTLQSCVAVLHDINAHIELFKDGKEHRMVEKLNDAHIITYLQVNLPFPLRDRDGFYDIQFSYSPVEETVFAQINCLDTYEEKKRVVRLDYCKGTWIFQKITADKIKISHTFHTDPKGALPAWIVNKHTVESPIHTLTALKRLVELPKYQGHKFDFIK